MCYVPYLDKSMRLLFRNHVAVYDLNRFKTPKHIIYSAYDGIL